MKIIHLFAFAALIYPAGVRRCQTPGLVLPFKQVVVSSPVLQDIVKDIAVEEGDQVKKGDVLAHLLNDRKQLQVSDART